MAEFDSKLGALRFLEKINTVNRRRVKIIQQSSHQTSSLEKKSLKTILKIIQLSSHDMYP